MPKTITPLQERDTCLALTLVLLLIWLFTGKVGFVYAGMAMLVYGMVWSRGMRPLARLWFGLSLLLGTVMGKVLLSIVYVLLVLPVALVRRAMGKDSLGLGSFKKGDASLFVVRDHRFVADDISHPY